MRFIVHFENDHTSLFDVISNGDGDYNGEVGVRRELIGVSRHQRTSTANMFVSYLVLRSLTLFVYIWLSLQLTATVLFGLGRLFPVKVFIAPEIDT